MFKPLIASSKLLTSMLIALGLVSSIAFAQDAVSDPALAISTKSKDLQWADCPAFLPKGCKLSVLHGDPAKPNVDVFFKLPGRSTLPLHWHTSAERMTLVSGKLQITYNGQKEAIVRAGDYMYGPPKLAHKGYCASKEPCILFIAFESPLDAVPGEVPAM
jgi:quercetin dioxygenase-like cupin family protein